MYVILLAVLAAGTSAASVPSPSTANPLYFFEGRTESTGVMRVMFGRPSRTHSVGQGRVEGDGSLSLVQKVDDEGKPAHERRWHIRLTGKGRFVGTVSEASSKVVIDEVSGRYRFRFRVKGGMAVEQWMEALPDGASVRYSTSVRKFGMKVAAGKGIIRKIPPR